MPSLLSDLYLRQAHSMSGWENIKRLVKAVVLQHRFRPSQVSSLTR